MKDRERLTCWIHHSMAVTGGYLGVYALLTRADLFGNAQTCNLIYIITGLFGHDFTGVFLRIVGACIFFAGIALTVVLSKKTSCNLQYFSFTVNCITVLALGFLPSDINQVIGLYPFFFATAVQWNSFPGAYGFASSTIFSTNNLRQVANAAEAEGNFLCRHNCLLSCRCCLLSACVSVVRDSFRLAVLCSAADFRGTPDNGSPFDPQPAACGL